MKTLKKIVLFSVIIVPVLLLAGCGGYVGADVRGGLNGHQYNNSYGYGGGYYGGYNRGRYYNRGIRVPPCTPYNADAIMGWATELDNPRQRRSASVNNYNGRVRCTTNESAGSSVRSQRTYGR